MSHFDAVALARSLVRVDSRNPSLVVGAPGEAAVARELMHVLEGWGFTVEMLEASAGRPNVVARIGKQGRRMVMFNGHLDVVGIEGMTHAPFDAELRDGRIYGRGATDMKSGVAAMCAAAARAAEAGLEGEIIVCGVCDEEYRSIGTSALIERGIRADAAIVTEPTRLAIAPAHKGFAWFTVTLHGRAAHGSRYDMGVDAIMHAGLLLAQLDMLENGAFNSRTHPLLGRASVHASLIGGGTGMSTYPDRCVLHLERRTLPGESAQDAERQILDACAAVKEQRPDFHAAVELTFSQLPSDVRTDAPVVLALDSAIRSANDPVEVMGLSAWTDAALLNAAGIPAICYGPGDIALAHAAEEYVEVEEIERATDVLSRFALAWLNGDRR